MGTFTTEQQTAIMEEVRKKIANGETNIDVNEIAEELGFYEKKESKRLRFEFKSSDLPPLPSDMRPHGGCDMISSR